jgi:hypothetical protein
MTTTIAFLAGLTIGAVCVGMWGWGVVINRDYWREIAGIEKSFGAKMAELFDAAQENARRSSALAERFTKLVRDNPRLAALLDINPATPAKASLENSPTLANLTSHDTAEEP